LRNQQPALYFDVTDIVEHAMSHTTVTGIQRSVLRILESLICQGCGLPVYGLVKHPVTGAFKIADLDFIRGPYNLRDFVTRFEFPCARAQWLARKLRNYRKTPIKRFIRAGLLKFQWATSRERRAPHDAMLSESRPSCLRDLELVPGSVIVSPGAAWATDYRSVELLARSHGCKTAAVVYDIVPISAPHYCGLGKKRSLQFQDWLDHISQNFDTLICGSHFTKAEVENYLAPKRATADIKVVRLAHEFKAPNDQGEVNGAVCALATSEYILCVGTIEIRKNILELLHAWAAMRESRAKKMPNLVLAGGRGWKVDDVYDFLGRTANVGGTVKIVDKPSDAELEFLYRHCAFTVFPSRLEGWGLPIGESLWFGKPVICAASSSMPEVGGRFATYFSHDEPNSLLAALESMLDNPVSLPRDIRCQLTTWNATARSIAAALDTIPETPAEQAPALAVH
jgi:glycosyltransferase involved in cell wall biosynthesis